MKKWIISLMVVIATITTTTVYAYTGGLIKTNNKELFNINFQNIKNKQGNGNVYLDENTNLTFDCDLKVPGDAFEFTVDIVNNSDKDAKVEDINITKLTEEQERFLVYTVTYENGEEIKKDDILKSNNKVTLKVKAEFKYDITAEDLPKEKQNIDLTFNINMVEK